MRPWLLLDDLELPGLLDETLVVIGAIWAGTRVDLSGTVLTRSTAV